MIVCFLKIAKSTLNSEQICLISRLLNVEADSRFKHCINRALQDGEWCVVDHMLRLYDMDTTTLHQVLVKAMPELRKWTEVEACLERGADIATACTETGFDLNARSGESNRTVLHDAISRKNMEKKMVRALLQAGADPNVPDSDGEPVLHFVCKKGQADLVRELCTTQTVPLATDGKGNTLIMAALGGAESKNVRDDYFRENVIRVLIQSGVATHQALLSQSQLRSLKQEAQNVTVDSFQSPLWQAVQRHNFRIARMLYAAGACCNEEIHELVNSESIGHRFEDTNQRDILNFSEDFFSHFHSRFDYQPDDASACCHTEIHELANSEYVRQEVKYMRNNRAFLAFLNDIFSHVRSQGVHYTVGMCCTQKHNAFSRQARQCGRRRRCNQNRYNAFRYEDELQFVRQTIKELKNWCDIMDFLNPISSHPRSLRDICALTISHLIGCGPQRDERADSLGLPDSLRRRVLQDHVISSDFLKDYPPDPEDIKRERPFRDYWYCGYDLPRQHFPPRFREPFCSCQIE